MTFQASTAVRNASLDAIETTIGTGAVFAFYTGTAPASLAANATGTALGTIKCPSDWMNAASAGSKTLLGSWSGTANAVGSIGYFRGCASDGTTAGIQGTCGLTGGSGEILLSALNFETIGQAFSITGLTWVDGNA
jgi:hypothetical protein